MREEMVGLRGQIEAINKSLNEAQQSHSKKLAELRAQMIGEIEDIRKQVCLMYCHVSC